VFEDRFHRLRAEGEVSPAKLSELMLAAQKECYCDGLADGEYNPRFWVSKLHFYITYVPFYNFPYTFGYLLSLGLYGLAKQNAKDFPQQYREFLRGTGRMTAEDAVKTAFGDDLTKPGFWQRSMDEVESRVTRFVELAK
jgi:oligoendopeptidase F